MPAHLDTVERMLPPFLESCTAEKILWETAHCHSLNPQEPCLIGDQRYAGCSRFARKHLQEEAPCLCTRVHAQHGPSAPSGSAS